MANPRADYSPIFHRKPLKLPGNARVAVWPCINVEEWDINATMARAVLPSPQGAAVTPDIANFAWFDYGLRVGFWRFKQVLDRHGIRATVSLNASVCDTYPQLVRESLEAGWEMLGHGVTQRVIHSEPDERKVIQQTIRMISDFTGVPLRGWMGPGLAETFDTPDILAEEGIEYVADWCNDDQPYEMKVKSGRLVSIPYTVELNDIPIYIVQHHRSPEIFERARDQFDTLYREGAESARIMCISTHPYITGVPHRIKYYDMIFDYIRQFEGVVFMTGSEILDWYNESTAES
jgi:peptidoglycan/xylan/chitin deacetylase (PgdA/CDA1 family)|tara:strand:+ start:846 stop:1718 length:873 start_codon:yes stop_codon:yes gene_type:complete